jgi:hypothetical protein
VPCKGKQRRKKCTRERHRDCYQSLLAASSSTLFRCHKSPRAHRQSRINCIALLLKYPLRAAHTHSDDCCSAAGCPPLKCTTRTDRPKLPTNLCHKLVVSIAAATTATYVEYVYVCVRDLTSTVGSRYCLMPIVRETCANVCEVLLLLHILLQWSGVLRYTRVGSGYRWERARERSRWRIFLSVCATATVCCWPSAPLHSA